MARPAGVKKTPGSGRKKGTPNKPTMLIEEKVRELGVDPIEILCLIAKGDKKGLNIKTKEPIDLDLRHKAAKELAQYLYPKRKAVELSGVVAGVVQPIEDYLKELDKK